MLLAKTCEPTFPSQYGDHATTQRQTFCVPGGRCTLMMMASASDICPCPSVKSQACTRGKNESSLLRAQK